MRVSLAASAEAHQDLLLQRANVSAAHAEASVRRVWLDLLKLVQSDARHAYGASWHHVYPAARRILRTLPAVAQSVETDLVAAASDAARHTARQIAARLSPAQRSRLARCGRPHLLEAEEPDLLGDLETLLTGPTAHQVLAVVRAAGWGERIAKLTRLADPDALAGRIATLVQQGATPRKIAAEIRPLVQDVQTSARRVARTASLWVAHEVELHQWEELGDMVAGYEIHAVLDGATRPAHRKRDKTRYWRKPKRGQKGFGEMPRPPREASGDFAFNCRCYLSPVLAD